LAFTWEALDAAANALAHALARLKVHVMQIKRLAGKAQPVHHPEDLKDFRAAVEDDLNTPRALAAMWSVVKESEIAPERTYGALLEMDKVLGLGLKDIREVALPITDKEVDGLIDERNAARKQKDFARADEIRDRLAEMGVEIQDTPSGTIWQKAIGP